HFHDTLNGLPPSCIGMGGKTATVDPGVTTRNEYPPRVSFWVLIMPYLEQLSLYNLIVTTTDNFYEPMLNSTFWNTFSDEQHKGFQISFYRCPSRRGGSSPMIGQRPGAVGSHDDQMLYGTQGDYAFVVGRASEAWAGWGMDPGAAKSYVDGTNNLSAENIKGPFRPALWENGTPRDWRIRDTFSRLQDGTSNQIIVGEKMIINPNIGLCEYVDTGGNRPKSGDCSILVGGIIWAAFPAMRSFNGRIGRSSDLPETTETHTEPQNHWGSSHSGVCHFLLGDGSVRALPVTIPTGPLTSTSTTSILAKLGQVDDGNTISIP
ncbi:MAG: DUF1559 domain-containing protein, partial [Planctomycetaceae bacterium]|nr:DUF1559 domain-containing protein [Planctomycetaceae bacterium]